MTALASAWSRWAALWARKEPATPLALFRIVVGAIVWWTLVDMIRTDTVVPIWLHSDHGGLEPLKPNSWLIQALGGATPEVVWPLLFAAIAVATVFTLGLPWLTQPSALLLNQLCIALFSLHPGAGGGHDRLIINALWLLVFAPSARTLSVACWARTRRWWSDEPVAAWVRYLIVIQLCIVYGTTGIQKLGSEWFPWGGYEAVYRSMLLTSWLRWDLSWLMPHIHPLSQAATGVSWLWEVTFPVVLLTFWFRATRTRPGRLRAFSNRVDLRVPYALVGAGMHLTLWVAMNLGPFSAITMAYYAALWHHDEWVALWRRIRGLPMGPRGATAQGAGASR